MILSEYDNIKIAGVASCVPKNVVKTIDYGDQFGQEKVEKFIAMSGVKERHVALDKQTASDLAFQAADELLRKKNINKQEIGTLIFVTETPDYLTPSTAFVLQKRLELDINCICFDINLGCSGFVVGFNTLAAIMRSSNITKGLLLFGDTMTKKISPEDRSVCMLIGDAGGAVLLEKDTEVKEISTAYRSDGSKYRHVYIPAGGSRRPNEQNVRAIADDGNVRGPYDFYMDGANIFFFSTSDVVNLVREYLQEKNKSHESYDAIVLHQANEYIIKNFAKRCKFPMEKIPISIGEFGNTVGSCITVTLSKEYGEIENEPKRLLMCGFGVGLSWGLVDAEINTSDILPIIYSDDYYIEE